MADNALDDRDRSWKRQRTPIDDISSGYTTRKEGKDLDHRSNRRSPSPPPTSRSTRIPHSEDTRPRSPYSDDDDRPGAGRNHKAFNHQPRNSYSQTSNSHDRQVQSGKATYSRNLPRSDEGWASRGQLKDNPDRHPPLPPQSDTWDRTGPNQRPHPPPRSNDQRRNQQPSTGRHQSFSNQRRGREQWSGDDDRFNRRKDDPPQEDDRRHAGRSDDRGGRDDPPSHNSHTRGDIGQPSSDREMDHDSHRSFGGGPDPPSRSGFNRWKGQHSSDHSSQQRGNQRNYQQGSYVNSHQRQEDSGWRNNAQNRNHNGHIGQANKKKFNNKRGPKRDGQSNGDLEHRERDNGYQRNKYVIFAFCFSVALNQYFEGVIVLTVMRLTVVDMSTNVIETPFHVRARDPGRSVLPAPFRAHDLVQDPHIPHHTAPERSHCRPNVSGAIAPLAHTQYHLPPKSLTKTPKTSLLYLEMYLRAKPHPTKSLPHCN